MFKKTIYLLLILLFSVFVTACSGGEEDNASQRGGKIVGRYKHVPRNFEERMVSNPGSYSLSDKPSKTVRVKLYQAQPQTVDYINDGIDREPPVYKISYQEAGSGDDCSDYKQAFGVQWCPEQGYVESVRTMDVDELPPEGYIEKFGPRPHGPEGYIEKFGERSHGTEGYVEIFGAESHGPEGYIEKFGERGHGVEGYVERFGAESHGAEGYIEKFGPRGHGAEGYLEKFGSRGHGLEGYIETIGGLHGAEGYVEIFGNRSHGPEGYTELIGGTHGAEGYTQLIGGSHGVEGYTGIFGVQSHGEEGYIERFGPRGHGAEGYLEKFGYTNGNDQQVVSTYNPESDLKNIFGSTTYTPEKNPYGKRYVRNDDGADWLVVIFTVALFGMIAAA